MIEGTLLVIRHRKAERLFEKLWYAWKNLEHYKQSGRRLLFLRLLQTALEQSEKENLSTELADWAANKLPDVFWYEWVKLISE